MHYIHLLHTKRVGDIIIIQFALFRQNFINFYFQKILLYYYIETFNFFRIYTPANYFQGVIGIKIDLGKKIKNLRTKSGLTQAQLADKLNISASTVGMYEQGRREPDSATLAQICRTLDASSDYVLDLTGNTLLNQNPQSGNNEIYSVISEFINNLEKQDNLMFNGEPINNGEKKKITSALKVATAVTLSDINCKI